MPKSNRPRMDEAVEEEELKKPRYWAEKAPQENWNKSIPATTVPNSLFEVVQEISTSPLYEFGGRMAPVVRQALEDFCDKYAQEGSAATTLYKQMRRFRDYWVDDVLTTEMVQNVQVIETSLDRWRETGDIVRLIDALSKILDSGKELPPDWRMFIYDKLKRSRAMEQAMEYGFMHTGDGSWERKQLDLVHSVVMEG